jgi:hypothetical protein
MLSSCHSPWEIYFPLLNPPKIFLGTVHPTLYDGEIYIRLKYELENVHNVKE